MISQGLIKILGRKITQKEIAEALNLDRTSIAKKTQRGSELTLDHKYLIEKAFGVNLELLKTSITSLIFLLVL